MAERYLKTGNLIYIEGKRRTRSYLDDHNKKQWVSEILGKKLIMLNTKTGSSQVSSKTADDDIYGNQVSSSAQKAELGQASQIDNEIDFNEDLADKFNKEVENAAAIDDDLPDWLIP